MENLKNITVTKICNLLTVNSERGRKETIHNRNNYGLSFCINGQITYTHKGKEFISTKDCAIILPKGQTYSIERNKKGLFPVINFDCVENLCDTIIKIPIDNPEKFIKDFEYLKQLTLFDGNRLKSLGVFYNMLHHLSRSKSAGVLTPAVKYIEKNISDATMKNSDLAILCGISEVFFRKLFIKHISMTPRQFIIDLRLAKAKQMLSEGGLKISAIAQECGFSNPYHFSRLFKQKTGLIPTEYMEQNIIRHI